MGLWWFIQITAHICGDNSRDCLPSAPFIFFRHTFASHVLCFGYVSRGHLLCYYVTISARIFVPLDDTLTIKVTIPKIELRVGVSLFSR